MAAASDSASPTSRTASASAGGIIAIAICIIALAVAAGAVTLFPRTFSIPGIGNNGSSTAPNSATSGKPSATVAGVGTFADPAMPLTPVNPTAYDAKLVAVAHIPPAPPAVASSTATATAVTATSTTVALSTPEEYPPFAIAPSRSEIASLWPVPENKAPLPSAGALLPFNRIVAYYGNLYSTQMGVLGEYPEPQMLAMLASTTAMWQEADTSTHVIPALDYIAVTAQASPGPDDKYRDRMPADQIDEILQMAAQINGLVILDVQVGDSNVETEVPLLEQYLKLPQVELALDPEFDMHNGAKPGTVIGSMDAADINWAANYLANLVTQYNLPPKILIVHRFTQDMVMNTNEIAPLPQVQIVMDMDGFGSEEKS